MKTLIVLLFALILALGLLSTALAQPDGPGDPPSAQLDAPARDGVSWRGGVLEQNGEGASIVLDAQELLYLSFSYNGVRYAVLGAGDTSLVLDTAGQLCAVYMAYYDNRNWSSTGPVEVKVRRKHAAGWQAETVASQADVPDAISLALDNSGPKPQGTRNVVP